jgi:hypothetical protein
MPDWTSRTCFTKISLGGKHVWATACFRTQKSRRKDGNRSTQREAKRWQEVTSLEFVPTVKDLEFMPNLGLMKLHLFKCQLSAYHSLEIGTVSAVLFKAAVFLCRGGSNQESCDDLDYTSHYSPFLYQQTHLFVSLNSLVMTVLPVIAILTMYIVTWTCRAPT